MATKKVSTAAEQPKPDQTATDLTAVDLAGADAATNAADTPPAAQLEPAPASIPDPIVATDDAGRQRPLSGGSFVRQPDGSIVRNPEA